MERDNYNAYIWKGKNYRIIEFLLNLGKITGKIWDYQWISENKEKIKPNLDALKSNGIQSFIWHSKRFV